MVVAARAAKPRGWLCRKCLTGCVVSVIVLLNTACSGIAIVNALTPTRGYERHEGVRYAAGERGLLDVYVPDAAEPSTSGRSLPVVVFFYGGSWSSGNRGDYRFLAAALAARGMIVVVPDYRLYPEVSYPGFLDDCAQATAWVLHHAGEYSGDAKRVFVMGHSAGAYNAAMMAYDARWLVQQHLSPDAFAGFIGLAGPYNFLPIVDPGVNLVFHWPDTPRSSQPIEHIRPGAPPALLIAPGEGRDPVVDPEQNTEAFAAALKDKGVPVTVNRYDALNHYTSAGAIAWPLRWLAPVLDDVTAFVEGASSRSSR